MAKLQKPPPSEELAQLAAEIRTLPKGTSLSRLYFRGGAHPSNWSSFRAFGPTSARFDHHISRPVPKRRIVMEGAPTQEAREILYLATEFSTTLAEVFQETRVVDLRTKDPWLVVFETGHELQLLDLTGKWPLRTGRASTTLMNGRRDLARLWSQAIHEAYPSIHGLYYESEMTNEPCIALYERAKGLPGLIPAHPSFHRSLSDPTWFAIVQWTAIDIGYRCPREPL
jgi:hypothetical protein